MGATVPRDERATVVSARGIEEQRISPTDNAPDTVSCTWNGARKYGNQLRSAIVATVPGDWKQQPSARDQKRGACSVCSRVKHHGLVKVSMPLRRYMSLRLLRPEHRLGKVLKDGAPRQKQSPLGIQEGF